MKQSQGDKHFLNLAGEYAVCSELAKRKITANITYGNYKAVDIIIVDKNQKAYTIEIKTTMSNRVVTGFFQKYHTQNTPHPDFWVIVRIDENSLTSKFYILTHEEMAKVQMSRNKMDSWHSVTGVDNVLIQHIEKYENCWECFKLQFENE